MARYLMANGKLSVAESLDLLDKDETDWNDSDVFLDEALVLTGFTKLGQWLKCSKSWFRMTTNTTEWTDEPMVGFKERSTLV